MKKLFLVLAVVLIGAGMMMAQTDVLGAHLVYGRGCVACHAPHSGAAGNGEPNANSPGTAALWGEDMSPLYGKTLAFGDNGSYTVTLPASAAAVQSLGAHDGTFAIIACLSCHDGNLAKPAMMKGTTVESIPAAVAGGSANPPTFLGNDGTGAGNYLNDHPVGPNAIVGCGGQYNWDCTVNANGSISFAGAASSQFLTDYVDVTKAGPIASIVKVPNSGTSLSWVTCTTCHDQHSMTDFKDSNGVHHPTMFFVKGWYNPASGDSAAQFCRSCHGGESNEMHGITLTTY